MRFGSRVALAFALFGGGCAHTVGSLEVAARATVDFDCEATDIYVQTLARNHYAATGCGRRAIFICHSGACARDSEVTPASADARVFVDAYEARGRLNLIRGEVLACIAHERSSVIVEVAFAIDGTSRVRRERVGERAGQCLDDTFDAMPPAEHGYEHPLYMRHVFTTEAWAPPAAPAPPTESTPPVEPVAPVEPPPPDPAATTAMPPPVP
jgi:hypothetical protein